MYIPLRGKKRDDEKKVLVMDFYLLKEGPPYPWPLQPWDNVVERQGPG